jgi:hypothetical protein
MERRSWCPPTWDMTGHGACDSRSQTLCYFDATGQSTSSTLQHADYDNPDCQAVPEAFTTSLQSMHGIPCGDEITPLEAVQYIPDWAPITAQRPKEIFPELIASERSPTYHSHSQRITHDTRTAKEDDELPEVRHSPM